MQLHLQVHIIYLNIFLAIQCYTLQGIIVISSTECSNVIISKSCIGCFHIKGYKKSYNFSRSFFTSLYNFSELSISEFSNQYCRFFTVCCIDLLQYSVPYVYEVFIYKNSICYFYIRYIKFHTKWFAVSLLVHVIYLNIFIVI